MVYLLLFSATSAGDGNDDDDKCNDGSQTAKKYHWIICEEIHCG
jgi:hypothetical protein